jgi:uncharacterized membrane protein
VAFGAAHFAYLKQTAGLVPAGLPAPELLVRLTGAAYGLAGFAVLAEVGAALAAALATLQIALFSALVWGPAVAGGSADASQWSEALVSWSLTVSSLVVALSYRRASPDERRR